MNKMLSRTSNETIIAELQRISRMTDGGLLKPEMVLEVARQPSSVLHKYFTWDDTKAAQKYRLYEARELINATYRWYKVDGDKRPVRVFVSLSSDRKHGGGYRSSIHVLGNKELREQMLQDALDELDRVKSKYGHLEELSEVFVASRKVRNRLLKAWAA